MDPEVPSQDILYWSLVHPVFFQETFPLDHFAMGVKIKLFGLWNCLPSPVCVRLVQGPVTVELGDLITSISCQRICLVKN